MHHEMVMPELFGDGVTEVVIVQWLKRVGEFVGAGEPLLDVMTDKTNVEVPAATAGILDQQCAPEEARVRVGEVIAVIRMVTR